MFSLSDWGRAAERARVALMRACDCVDAGVAGKRQEAEVTVFQHARFRTWLTFDEGGMVEDTDDLLGGVVRDIWYVLEAVFERADDETVIIRKGTFDEIEANASGVNEDQAWNICPRGINDDCGKCRRKNSEDVP